MLSVTHARHRCAVAIAARAAAVEMLEARQLLAADVAIILTDAPDPIRTGDEITYTLTLTNNGPEDANDVKTVSPIPSNAKFVSFAAPAPPGTVTFIPGQVNWDLGTVTAGSSQVLKYTLAGTSIAGTTVTATATETSSTPDLVTENNSASTTTTLAPILVTNTDDSGPGSLRQAILDANSLGFSQTIDFAIPGPGVHTILLLSGDLPHIMTPVLLDGYSQPGSAPNTLGPGFGTNAVIDVEVDANGFKGLFLDSKSDGSTIRGLALGESITTEIYVGTEDIVVSGNFIGVRADGVTPWPIAQGVGVRSLGARTRVGGLLPADRNLISANSATGVEFVAPYALAQGNLIGTDRTGMIALGNGPVDFATGMFVDTPIGTVIGGTTPAARNVISGNPRGITTGGGSVIEGNFIGTDVTGANPLPNGVGIYIENSAGRLFIGGSTPLAGNVISGNRTDGIRMIGSLNVTVAGNFIGTNAAGTGPIPNGHNGILMSNSFDDHDSQGNIIGGSAAARNVIAYNVDAGVALLNVNGDIQANPNNFNAIRFNAIYGNGGLSIDLTNDNLQDGITFNDNLDPDRGPNNLQNTPILSQVNSTAGGASTQVKGFLNSTASTTFIIDVYASDVGGTGGTATAKTYVGAFFVTTNSAGNAFFDETIPVATPAGQYVTSTATTIATFPTGNTSELSAPVQVSAPPAPPMPPTPPSLSISDVTQSEGTGGSTTFTFSVTRTGDTTGTSTVNFATSDGTAASPGDYTSQSGTLTFGPGITSQPISVTVVPDSTVESNENFVVNLSGVSGASIADGQGGGTITNDDVAPPAPPATAVIAPDPAAPGKMALIVTGTDKGEYIDVDPGSSSSKLKVEVDDVLIGEFNTSAFDRIYVYAKGGDDRVSITTSTTKTAVVFGGDGQDQIKGGSGKDILLGEGGADIIRGRKGRDVIIGGLGADGISGDEDDDLIIAAATTFDVDLPGLFAFQKEWVSSNTYSKRRDNVRNGTGSNVGGRKLNETSILEDNALDLLSGNSGTDLFFYHKTGSATQVADKINDKSSSETAVDAS